MNRSLEPCCRDCSPANQFYISCSSTSPETFRYDTKLRLGNKWWWPDRTNSDTSERKCAIVSGLASATYKSLPMLLTPCQRDTYGQPWLTMRSQRNSGFSGRIFPPDQMCSTTVQVNSPFAFKWSLLVWRISNLRVNVIRSVCAGTVCGHLT